MASMTVTWVTARIFVAAELMWRNLPTARPEAKANDSVSRRNSLLINTGKLDQRIIVPGCQAFPASQGSRYAK